MVSPGLPVQELWEHIIDSVHSKAELKSCSLVCHAFVARAQSHIFRSISINGPLSSILAQHELPNRLTNLMASSPHLIRYVEAITIVAFDEEVLTAIAGITWPHLKHIGLDRVRSWKDDVSPWQNITTLVAIPPLRELTLTGCGSKDIYRILSLCHERLEMVMLEHCWMTSGPPNPPHARPPIAIRQLFLSGSSDMVELLSEPQFPLDFTALTEIEILGPWDPRLPTFFRRTRSNVKKLHFSGFGTLEEIQGVEFSMFPSLTHITAHGLGLLFETVLNRLPVDNLITNVHLVLCDQFNELKPTVDLRHFERLLLRSLPRMRQVEVEVRRVNGENPSEARRVLEADLPVLHQKGLLIVSFPRLW